MSDWANEAEKNLRKQDELLKVRLKRNGPFLLIMLALTALLLKSMPLHVFWNPFGPIAVLATLYFFVTVIVDSGTLVHGILLKRHFAKQRPSEAVEYVPPKPRSGRRSPRER